MVVKNPTRLRALRLLGGLNIHELARALEIDPATLTRIETRVTEPTPEQVRKIEKHFNHSFDRLSVPCGPEDLRIPA